jgi:hypothetical protein
MQAPDPNWAEQLTAVATAIGALGLLGGIAAAIFAGRQVGEARKSRDALMAAEFFRRWNEDPLVETRQLVGRFRTKEELSAAFQGYVADGAPEAYVLYRELDFFEQLGALAYRGAFDIELIKLLVGKVVIERWELWQPALQAVYGAEVYPMFADLAVRMRKMLDTTT